jgi:hypothetical protein
VDGGCVHDSDRGGRGAPGAPAPDRARRLPAGGGAGRCRCARRHALLPVRGLAGRGRRDRRSPGRAGGGPRRRRRRVRRRDRPGGGDRPRARDRLPAAGAGHGPARGAGGARGGSGVPARGPAHGDRPRPRDGRRADGPRLDAGGGRCREHRRADRDLGACTARTRPPARGRRAGALRRAQAARHRGPDRLGHGAGTRSRAHPAPGLRPPGRPAERRLRLRRPRHLRSAADRPGVDARRAGRGLRRRRCDGGGRCRDRGLGNVVCGRRLVRGRHPGRVRARPANPVSPAASPPGPGAASTSRIAAPPAPPR